MINFRKYELPFKTPFVTAAGSFSHREGILIEGEACGIRFSGDASPLPGFSTETCNEVHQFLNEHKASIETLFSNHKKLTDFDKQCIELQAPPSVRFGMSTAMGNVLATQKGLSLAHYLNPLSQPRIPVNVTLGARPSYALLDDALKAWEEGYKTFKVKVGQDPDAELESLIRIRKHLPECHLRIDANGAWNVDQAIQILNKFAPTRIEYCEQPVGANDLKSFITVKRNSPIPIAADESIRSFSDATHFIQLQAVDVLILKPMLIGTISEFNKIIELADSNDIAVVVTTSLESGIGRRATAQLAACQKNQPFAHGLATGRLLQNDILDDSAHFKNGFYYPG
ncbi:MAG: o-succinylbenzoate synthase [Balneolales bacterium]